MNPAEKRERERERDFNAAPFKRTLLEWIKKKNNPLDPLRENYYDFWTRVRSMLHPFQIISREIRDDVFLSNKLLISRQASCKISRGNLSLYFPTFSQFVPDATMLLLS